MAPITLDPDADLAGQDFVVPKMLRAETHPHELRCSACGCWCFADGGTFGRARWATAFDPDPRPFLCPACDAEADGAAGH